MFRAPTWRMSAYSATMSTWFGSMTSVMVGQAGAVPGFGEVAERLDSEALEAVGRRARLEGAAPQDGRARRLHRVGRLEQLIAALDRAGPGHDRQAAVADRRVEDADDGVLGPEFAGGELEGSRDRGDRLDARQGPEAAHERGPAWPDLADDGDHDAVRAGVVVGRHALAEDVALHPEDLGLGGGAGHHDEHGASFLWDRRTGNKKAEVWTSASSRHDACLRPRGPETIMPGR